MYIACDERVAVEYILRFCSDLIEVRQAFYSLITDDFIRGATVFGLNI